MTVKKFLKECSEKEVFKKLSIYIVTSWLLIQVLSSVWEPLGLPARSLTILIILLLIGFPINIFLVWKFHLSGLEEPKPKLDADGNPKPGKFKKSQFKKMYFSSLFGISLLTLVLILFIINNKFIDTMVLKRVDSSDKIAILKFDNNTMDPKSDIIGKMTADWISHGITENKVAQVVSPEIIEDYEKFLKESILPGKKVNVLNDYLKPAKIIHGNFYLKGDKLLFQCSIGDGDLDETFISFKPIECDAQDPMECIESLKQLVLGYLMTSDKEALNLQENPPKFKAYQAVLNAKAISDPERSERYLAYLNEAIAIDSDYFYPKVLRVGHYFNEGKYRVADSLLNLIEPASEFETRQQKLLDFYNAVLNGEYNEALELLKYEYNFAPFDLETNGSLMVLNHQFVNRPVANEEVYKEIPMTDMDLGECEWCLYRVYIMAMGEIEQQRYDKAIELVRGFDLQDQDLRLLKNAFVRALVRSGNLEEINVMLSELSRKEQSEILAKYFLLGKEFSLVGDQQKAREYFDLVIRLAEAEQDKEFLARSLYFTGQYAKSAPLLKDLVANAPQDMEYRVYLAVGYFKLGKETLAEDTLEQLIDLRDDFQFGEIDYRLAQFYAMTDQESLMYNHLMKAVSNGHRFRSQSYHNDPHFVAFKDDKAFESILNYWN